MKPTGPIPPYFDAADDGMLTIAGRRADALIDAAGDTPLFVYDFGVVRHKVARFRAAMPAALRLHFAVKANPHPPFLAAMRAVVDGFDVASQGELGLAIDTGMSADTISFAGPGKRPRELAAAIVAGATLNV